jgi:hypothetical protein
MQWDEIFEKVLVLLITAIISGFLIPFIVSEIQRIKSRNEVVLKAQNTLLEDLSKTLLTYQTMLAEISWFRTSEADNEMMHQQAFKRYSKRSADLLIQWRMQIGRTRYLASRDISDKLLALQVKMFEQQDLPMWKLIKQGGCPEQWRAIHDVNKHLLTESLELITEIAKEMKITKRNVR